MSLPTLSLCSFWRRNGGFSVSMSTAAAACGFSFATIAFPKAEEKPMFKRLAGRETK